MRATRAFIHLENLKHNLDFIRNKYPDTAICLCVKADAYGHGLEEIAGYAENWGIEALAVAVVEEGEQLRKAGIKIPVMILGPSPEEDVHCLVKNDLTPIISDVEMAKLIDRESAGQNKVSKMHIKVDTGMSRYGCRPEDLAGLTDICHSLKNILIEGLCTHFASSDEADKNFTNQQLLKFTGLIEKIRPDIRKNLILHAANSGAIIQHEKTAFNMVRPGIIAYGYGHKDVKPVMELRSRIMLLRNVEKDTPVSYGSTYRTKEKTQLALVPAGYADGYSRALSNKGFVIINGCKYPIAGRVCMDQFVVDLGQNSRVKVGDEVTLFGPATPDLTAETLADLCQTISYEIICGISKRVPRIYLQES